jgi:hypothetical protein
VHASVVPYFLTQIFFRIPILQKQMAATQEFFRWVTTNFPDAYFVTMHQLVQWIQRPVPISQMNAWLGCGPGGKAAGASAVITPPAPAPQPIPDATPAMPVAPPKQPPVQEDAPLNVALQSTSTENVAAANVAPSPTPSSSALQRCLGTTGLILLVVTACMTM